MDKDDKYAVDKIYPGSNLLPFPDPTKCRRDFEIVLK
jgi:hypothetical protein